MIMSWSKVKKPFNKPIGWWYRKMLCEIGWVLYKRFNSGLGMYYRNLKKMVDKYGINLYGEKI